MKADPDIRNHAKRMRKAMTNAEVILWSRLRGRQINGWQFRRQHPIGRYIVDFASPQARLAVEVDGATHSTDREITYDVARTADIESAGWSVLRVGNLDIYQNLNGVLETIAAALPPSTPDKVRGTSPRKRVEEKAKTAPNLFPPPRSGGGVSEADGGGKTELKSRRTPK